VFSVVAVILDIIYYGYFVKDLFVDFIINFAIVAVISLLLFYTHSFAGGDCKLTIVLALMFPARLYIVFGNTNLTLIFTIAIAIFVGYCYLLLSSLWAIITKKVLITFQYIKNSILNFLKSYLSAIIYISLINIAFMICSQFGININVWILRILCIAVAWCVGKFSILKKWFFAIPVLVIVIVLSIIFKMIPISTNPENYILVLVLLFCQMAIKTSIYENIPVEQLKKGMILSTVSSVLMQSSITKGLPSVSTEDLKSRLTLDEVESVKIWARATHTDTLTIVKKIPFAIFISIGFISYFVFWSIEAWV
jgi:preflagellin peptidase FlaK